MTDIVIYDPWVDAAQARHEYGVDVVNQLPQGSYDAIILAVAHDCFKTLDLKSLQKDNSVVYDVKGHILPIHASVRKGIHEFPTYEACYRSAN